MNTKAHYDAVSAWDETKMQGQNADSSFEDADPLLITSCDVLVLMTTEVPVHFIRRVHPKAVMTTEFSLAGLHKLHNSNYCIPNIASTRIICDYTPSMDDTDIPVELETTMIVMDALVDAPRESQWIKDKIRDQGWTTAAEYLVWLLNKGFIESYGDSAGQYRVTKAYLEVQHRFYEDLVADRNAEMIQAWKDHVDETRNPGL